VERIFVCVLLFVFAKVCVCGSGVYFCVCVYFCSCLPRCVYVTVECIFVCVLLFVLVKVRVCDSGGQSVFAFYLCIGCALSCACNRS
jgi:hypothetical protein